MFERHYMRNSPMPYDPSMEVEHNGHRRLFAMMLVRALRDLGKSKAKRKDALDYLKKRDDSYIMSASSCCMYIGLRYPVFRDWLDDCMHGEITTADVDLDKVKGVIRKVQNVL